MMLLKRHVADRLVSLADFLTERLADAPAYNESAGELAQAAANALHYAGELAPDKEPRPRKPRPPKLKPAPAPAAPPAE